MDEQFYDQGEHLISCIEDYHDCLLTTSEVHELLGQSPVGAPTVSQLNSVQPSFKDTRFTIDHGKEFIWKHARLDLKHIQDQFSSEDGYITSAFDFMFSPNSVFMQCLLTATGCDDFDDLRRFLGTVCVQSAYGCSSTELFKDSSLLKDFALMNMNEYNAVWTVVGKSKQSEIGVSPRRHEPNWMALESALNQIRRDLSVAGRGGGKIILTLDDDKIWASNSGTNADDRFGLK